MNPRVNVLLATHNGANFLLEQLSSLDRQTLPPARITIRDDASTDTSPSILKEWASTRTDVSLFNGPRLGATRNFLTLLENAASDCHYFAFCDQDDVWQPDKLQCACATLGKFSSNQPLMYCSRVEFVDQQLRHLGYSRIPNDPGFTNALVENVATGGTIVMNSSARELIAASVPRKAILHDWWCYLVVSAFGRILYDPVPSIKYRQHGENFTGGTNSSIELFRRRFARFLKISRDSKILSGQAAEFHRCFGEILAPSEKTILERFLNVRGNLWKRLAYNLAMDVRRQSPLDTAILRTMIVFGKV